MLQIVWEWPIATYLFLGGLGAGAFVTAAVLRFYRRGKNRLTFCVSAWAALLCIGVGLILLLGDLVEPLRGMMMWQSFIHPTSWMVWGAWGLFGAAIIFFLTAVLSTLQLINPPWKFLLSKSEKEALAKGEKLPAAELPAGISFSVDASGAAVAKPGAVGASASAVRSPSLPARLEKPLDILAIVGTPFGLFVGLYTGILLMAAPGIPFWNTISLPFLFLVSAVDTGVALVEFFSVVLARKDPLDEGSHKLLLKFTVINVIIELSLLAIFLSIGAAGNPITASGAGYGTAAHDSAMMVIGGYYAPFFWALTVGLGLVMPFAINLSTLLIDRKRRKAGEAELSKKTSRLLGLIGSLGVLIGGCALRFIVLGAGMHPDIVMEAFKLLIS